LFNETPPTIYQLNPSNKPEQKPPFFPPQSPITVALLTSQTYNIFTDKCLFQKSSTKYVSLTDLISFAVNTPCLCCFIDGI